MKSMTYTDTFILVAADCPATRGTVPAARSGKPTGPLLEYELLTARPYTLDREELLFAVYIRRLGLSKAEAKARDAELRAELFAKSYACMRASALPKTYGWGVHHNGKGRIAIYPLESKEYREFTAGKDGVTVLPAMRNKRAE